MSADTAPAVSPSGFTRLPDYGLLRLEGERAREFLHGQATCDLLEAEAAALIGGACCTPKGRVVANFLLFADAQAPPRLHLRLRASMREPLSDFLQVYAKFSRTRLEIADWLGLGVAGSALAALNPPPPGRCEWRGEAALLRLDETRLECWGPAAAVEALAAEMPATLDEADWALLGVRAGRADLRPEGGEKYLPQMLNMDALGEVSFDKGCYTGQEVVARAQHRGAVKRRMYRLDCAAAPGAAVEAGGKSVGEVVAGGGGECLAVLSRAEAEGAALRVAGADATPLALPYALPD